MKKSALKNRIKSYWGKHKTTIFVVFLSFQLAIGLTIYLLFGRLSPNDKIFVPEKDSVAFLVNENPKFSVNFGTVEQPEKQVVRFEADTSRKNPFESEEGNIFSKIKGLFQKKERYGIEMSLVGVDLKKADLEKYGKEVIKVADIIGTDNVKTSTELIEVGREIGKYNDDGPVSKQTVLNKEVADGVDLEYQILTGLGLKEEIIIRDLESYKDSCKESGCKLPLNEFIFDLTVDEGVEIKEGWFTVDGKSRSTYYFVDSKGRYLAHFLPNYAVDNVGYKTFDVDLKVEKGGDNNYRAKVTVNLEWLLSSERVFPVRIDPSIVHDDTADFSGGIFNRTESITGPKIQKVGDTEAFDCTGGTVTTDGDYKVHKFTASGSLVCVGSGNVEALVVAGGGGGGYWGYGGGGGAGGMVEHSGMSLSTNTYTVTIGNGGAGSGTGAGGRGTAGQNSVFNGMTANGGGGGGGFLNDATSQPPTTGGSGGGGASGQSGAAATQGNSGGGTGYGYAGGAGNAGGGGGAGGAGGVGTCGIGRQSSISGTATYYSGGGGGYAKSGCSGGGGNSGVAGTANTGGGGGSSAAGGSGVVIVKYIPTEEEISFSGEYTSSSMDMGSSMSGATLSWTPSGVNTGNGETPYSTTSMIAQWNLNETSGTTAASGGTCGASCNGTLTNFASTGSQDAAAGTGWTANNKRWGAGALMFDGTNDYITTASLGFNYDTITMSVWVNPKILTSRYTIADLGTETTLVPQLEIGACNGGTNAVCVITPGVWQAQTANNVISTGDWYHIVYTKNGAGATHKIYVNGVEQTLTVNASATYASTAASKKVGSRAGTSQYFNGTIDSLSLYSRVLSADEILSNYQAGNIEFQYRVSTDNSTWSSWTSYGTSASDLAWDSFDYSSYLGDGADGALAPTGTFNLNTSTSGSRSYADGIAYKLASNPSGNSVVTVDTPNGLAAGDEILLINLKGSSTDYTDAGNYEFLEVSSVNTGTKTITTVGKVMNSYDGTTFSNQSVIIQRVPNYTSVTLDSTDILTASGWDGLTTTPTGTAGYYTGIVSFRATGTVTVGSTAKITAEGLGYRGGVGTWYNARGTGGETYGGNGGSGGYASTSNQYAGLTGFGGGGGGGYAVGASAGAAGQLGTGGGGGGGTYQGTAWRGRSGGGGGGGNGTVGSGGRTFTTTYGSAGSGLNGGAGSASLASSSAYGGGGGGGGISSYDNGVKKLFFGGGGGSGGGSSRTTPACAAGSNGGPGGGIVFISSNAISLSGNINADGGDGLFDDCGGALVLNPGGGGGGAGGTVKIHANSQISGSGTKTVAYGIGGIPPSSTDYGWGGNGGLGVINISGIAETSDSNIKMEGNSSTRYESGILEADQYTVALWHLDERGGTGAYLKDSSTNAYNATPSGATYSNSGKVGGARTLNGTSNYIDAPDIDTLGYFTYEAWVKLANIGKAQSIFDKEVGGALWPSVYMTVNSGNTVTFGFYKTSSTAQVVTSTATLSAGAYYHLAGTYDGSNVRIYINGVLNNTAAATGTPNDIANNLTIGAVEFSTSPYYRNLLDGTVDELRISNIARTANEIAGSYRLGRDTYINKAVNTRDLSSLTTLPIYIAGDRPGFYFNTTWGETGYSNYQPDANTVGLWHLDEASGTGAYLLDSSGSSNHGTPTGTTLIEGKAGAGRAFAGTGNFITLSSTPTTGTGSFTIEAWIKTSSTGVRKDLISYGTATTNNGIYFQINASNKLAVDLTNSAGPASATSVTDNLWHHVVVRNTAGTVQLFIDGAADGNSATMSPNITATAGNYFFGKNIQSTFPYTGYMDEVRISNIARTADEIRQAYEVGLRTHPVQIDFGASLVSGNLITGSGDTSFSIDATVYGLDELGSGIYKDEKIIVKENYDGTEYIAQGTVSAITASTGAVTVSSWDSGSTFPSAGYTVNADVFKWQREYIPIKNRTVSTHVDAANLLTFRITNGNEGRNIWIDDLRSTSGYLSDSAGEALTFPFSAQYFQYKAIFNTWDTDVTPYISQVQLDYEAGGPTMDQIMRHGKWFNSSGEKQPFWWVNTP